MCLRRNVKQHRVDPDNPWSSFDAPFYGRGQKVLQLQSDTKLDAPPFDDNEYLQAFKTG